MLGTLLFLGALGISGALCAKENYEMKRDSRTVDEKGNVHYYDRLCRDYINGERVQRVATEDSNGVTLYSTVGVNSHKVYNTSYGRGTQQLLDYSEIRKQKAIEYGDLAYSQYNPYFGRSVTTEIATGRTITCLFIHECGDKRIYKKWYFRPECQGKLDYNVTVDGDYGIDITREEYYKLDVLSGSHTCAPSDWQVRDDLEGRNR